jgi:hypothetical protein
MAGLLGYKKGGLLSRSKSKKKKKKTNPGAMDDDAKKRIKDRKKKLNKELKKLSFSPLMHAVKRGLLQYNKGRLDKDDPLYQKGKKLGIYN